MLKPLPVNAYSAKNCKELDQIAQKEHKINDLMERAGSAIFNAIQKSFPQTKYLSIVCGKGNNGGDGFMVAKLAHEAGFSVRLFTTAEIAEISEEAQKIANQCQKLKIKADIFEPNSFLNHKTDLIIDALLGTGIKGEVKPEFATVIETMNQHSARKLSIDIPSGLNADTGVANPCAVRATVTLTLIANKQGLYTADAPDHRGWLLFDDLDVPTEIYNEVENTALIGDLRFFNRLAKRPTNSHKNDYGHVLVIAGNEGYGGAATLAAKAALVSGAGVVSVATHPAHAALISTQCPELMSHAIASESDLKPLLDQATVLVIGPGLTESKWTETVLKAAFKSDLPKIIDAGAFDYLQSNSLKSDNWILTPHPGEAARLLSIDTKKVQADRFSAVTKIQKQYGGSVILKGCGSLIAVHDQPIFICSYGNPGMATAGMGDILAGLLGGLVAQGVSPENAASYGCCIHSASADKAVRRSGQQGLLASHLLSYISTFL